MVFYVDAICVQCGISFTTRSRSKTQCDGCVKQSTRNRSRSKSRAAHEIAFVGVDGEGVDRPDGRHDYVMLSVGGDTLFHEGTQLTFPDMMEFLYEAYRKHADAAFVGFFLGYDFTQWERLLPEPVARLLLSTEGIASRTSSRRTRQNPFPDPVVWEGYEFDVMANRRWKLRPHRHRKSRYNDVCANRTCGHAFQVEDDGPNRVVRGELDFDAGRHGTVVDFIRLGDIEVFFNGVCGVTTNGAVGGEQKPVLGWMYICDTGPFWQTSFVNVIDPKQWPDGPVCTDDEFATIVEGKANRSRVVDYDDTSYFESMRRYNVLENDILSRVTARLNAGFMNDHIPIRLNRNEWYGPGRAAQAWMDMLHEAIGDPDVIRGNRKSYADVGKACVRDNELGLTSESAYLSMPSWFYDAARASYYGGWFEQFMHGHVGDVWEYDINSAYPYIISTLPCLHTTGHHNGVYTRGAGTDYPVGDAHRWTLVHGIFRGTDAFIGSLPHRTARGLILRPQQTEGWYWLHEVDAAKRAGLVDEISVSEWVSLRACSCRPPFDHARYGIRTMYDLRLQVGKNTAAGKAFKLVYNSAYGKTAQSVGKPKYANPVYASLITSGCRTLILDAIATHPARTKDVCMVATDGVYFVSPHPSLPVDPNRLGAWDTATKTNLTQLMPGVYWDDASRQRIADGGSPKLKSRGISARDLAREINSLDRLFAEMHGNLLRGRFEAWPTFTMKTGMTIDTAKLALQRNDWSTAGRVRHGVPRVISSNPVTKRQTTPYIDTDSLVIRTHPYPTGPTLTTTPYSKAFGYQVTPDLVIDPDAPDPFDYWRDLMTT